jgi:hypothetical protein
MACFRAGIKIVLCRVGITLNAIGKQSFQKGAKQICAGVNKVRLPFRIEINYWLANNHSV